MEVASAMLGSEQLLSGDAFESLFTSFESTAFRLESREGYYEQDELRLFLTEGPDAVPEDFLSDWCALMRSHKAAGRHVERVRVVSEPHSPYTRFGLWLSGRNVAAGEDIRYLARLRAASLTLPTFDFWLFDSTRLYVVRFADDDTLLGAQPVTDGELVDQANRWREIAWNNAMPRDGYARQFPPTGRAEPVSHL